MDASEALDLGRSLALGEQKTYPVLALYIVIQSYEWIQSVNAAKMM